MFKEKGLLENNKKEQTTFIQPSWFKNIKISEDEKHVVLKLECTRCKKEFEILITNQEYMAYLIGVPVRQAFTNIQFSEQFLIGYCEDCYKLFR